MHNGAQAVILKPQPSPSPQSPLRLYLPALRILDVEVDHLGVMTCALLCKDKTGKLEKMQHGHTKWDAEYPLFQGLQAQGRTLVPDAGKTSG